MRCYSAALCHSAGRTDAELSHKAHACCAEILPTRHGLSDNLQPSILPSTRSPAEAACVPRIKQLCLTMQQMLCLAWYLSGTANSVPHEFQNSSHSRSLHTLIDRSGL